MVTKIIITIMMAKIRKSQGQSRIKINKLVDRNVFIIVIIIGVIIININFSLLL